MSKGKESEAYPLLLCSGKGEEPTGQNRGQGWGSLGRAGRAERGARTERV